MIRPPGFWWQKPSATATLLVPASAIYGAIAGARLVRQGARADVPVLCVGNPTVGGAGKTPAALMLARMLIEAGERPAFLTRGYGGALAGPVWVEGQGAQEIGDEPRLLARVARPWWRATARRAPRSRRRAMPPCSSWTTASRIRRLRRISPFSWSTAGAESATAASSRPARCARRSRGNSIARRRSFWSAR
jgi:hypothetical protein